MLLKDLSLILYPAILYLCLLIGWRYGRDSWYDYRLNGFDQSVSIRVGVVIGFVFASGMNASIWGIHRWAVYLGWDKTAETMMRIALDTSGPVRIALVAACILHLWAAARGETKEEKKKRFHRDMVYTASIILVTTVLAIGLD